MENIRQKNMKNNNFKKHPYIRQVQIIDEKPNFPISWLNTLGFCEYSLYLEHFKHITGKPTPAMIEGTITHNRLEHDFNRTAGVKTLDEITDISHTKKVISREFRVISRKYGVRGFIDEIHLMPGRIIIIDDKPGKTAYNSMKNQVYAYALAYMDQMQEKREIITALRNSKTGTVFWKDKFSEDKKEHIIKTIQHVHNLIEGTAGPAATKNPNKCSSCRFNGKCDEKK